MKKIKVLLISAEIAPFAIEGDLAQITSSLAHHLHHSGVELRVIIPFHKSVKMFQNKIKFKLVTEFVVRLSENIFHVNLLETIHDEITFWFIQYDDFFNRDKIYGYESENGHIKNYDDNLLRFSLFSKAVLELMDKVNYFPDILHCYSWNTALTPVFLKTEYRGKPGYENIKTLFTILNITFHGNFDASLFHMTGLPNNLFSSDFLEFYGLINLLKAGILFSDSISTVSKQYAEDIKTCEHGCGLEGVLIKRGSTLYGIENGIDNKMWDPNNDKSLFKLKFNSKKLKQKKEIKKKLCEKINLDFTDDNPPLIAFFSPLGSEGGAELVEQIKDELLNSNWFFIIIADGANFYKELFLTMAEINPQRIFFSSNNRDSEFFRQALAGSDLILLPSAFEPSNTLYMKAMRYGTIPVTYSTGSFADSISHNENGFIFDEYNANSFLNTIKNAATTYNNKKLWNNIVKNAMNEDHSQKKTAAEYLDIYKKLIAED